MHILKNDKFQGNLKTAIVDGKCIAIDPITHKPLTEIQRLKQIRERFEGADK